ncbi:unnamed protein product, partial [Mesorhabditis spiculigera]
MLRVVLFVLFSIVIAQHPWYQAFNPEEVREEARMCEQECMTTSDCDTGLSCFHATMDSRGCCLQTLKPNETGCVVDDQCKRACESTFCDKAQQPSRCLCEKGRHFLFNKCWKKCPEFAHPEPEVDPQGFSFCKLKVSEATALQWIRRNKRQLRNAFC